MFNDMATTPLPPAPPADAPQADKDAHAALVADRAVRATRVIAPLPDGGRPARIQIVARSIALVHTPPRAAVVADPNAVPPIAAVTAVQGVYIPASREQRLNVLGHGKAPNLRDPADRAKNETRARPNIELVGWSAIVGTGAAARFVFEKETTATPPVHGTISVHRTGNNDANITVTAGSGNRTADIGVRFMATDRRPASATQVITRTFDGAATRNPLLDPPTADEEAVIAAAALVRAATLTAVPVVGGATASEADRIAALVTFLNSITGMAAHLVTIEVAVSTAATPVWTVKVEKGIYDETITLAAAPTFVAPAD
jgi:hypothetical protein